jgi:hypothetical protein
VDRLGAKTAHIDVPIGPQKKLVPWHRFGDENNERGGLAITRLGRGRQGVAEVNRADFLGSVQT